jgi:hypothetical protein
MEDSTNPPKYSSFHSQDFMTAKVADNCFFHVLHLRGCGQLVWTMKNFADMSINSSRGCIRLVLESTSAHAPGYLSGSKRTPSG